MNRTFKIILAIAEIGFLLVIYERLGPVGFLR